MAKKENSEERGFLQAIEENPADVTSRLAYADWLEEHARAYEAMLQRVKAGVSEMRFKIRRKSDGLFCDRGNWGSKAQEFRQLAHVKSHIYARGGRHGTYFGIPVAQVEIVVVETRPQEIAAMPVSIEKNEWGHPTIAVTEPLPGDEPAS